MEAIKLRSTRARAPDPPLSNRGVGTCHDAVFQRVSRCQGTYLLSLFGFVIWVALAISLIFFAGVKPPLVTG